MDDEQVRARVAELESLLENLDERSAPVVEALAGLYGEALRRIVVACGAAPQVADELTRDELVSHLLMLHDLHPATLEERIVRALDEVRPYLGSHGGGVELVSVEGEIARVRFGGTCGGCSSSAATLKSTIEEAVLRAAPEIAAVEAIDDGADHAVPAVPFTVIGVTGAAQTISLV